MKQTEHHPGWMKLAEIKTDILDKFHLPAGSGRRPLMAGQYGRVQTGHSNLAPWELFLKPVRLSLLPCPPCQFKTQKTCNQHLTKIWDQINMYFTDLFTTMPTPWEYPGTQNECFDPHLLSTTTKNHALCAAQKVPSPSIIGMGKSAGDPAVLTTNYRGLPPTIGFHLANPLG